MSTPRDKNGDQQKGDEWSNASEKDSSNDEEFHEIDLDDTPDTQTAANGDPWLTSAHDWMWVDEMRVFERNGILCPAPERRTGLIFRYHEISHGGIDQVLATIKARFWWPRMRADVRTVVKHCEVCRIFKSRRLKQGLAQWPEPETKLDRVHLDHFHWRHEVFLLMADAFTAFIWVRRVHGQSTEETLNVLTDIFREFGDPKWVVADNAPGFRGLEATLEARGIKKISSIPEKPESNGLAERGVGIVKTTAKKIKACFPKMSIELCVAKAVESHNKTPSFDYAFSPYELMFGKPPQEVVRLGEAWLAKFEEVRRAVGKRRIKTYGDQVKPKVGDEVLVMSPKAKIELDPYPIIWTVIVVGANTCTLRNGDVEIKAPFGQLRVLPRLDD